MWASNPKFDEPLLNQICCWLTWKPLAARSSCKTCCLGSGCLGSQGRCFWFDSTKVWQWLTHQLSIVNCHLNKCPLIIRSNISYMMWKRHSVIQFNDLHLIDLIHAWTLLLKGLKSKHVVILDVNRLGVRLCLLKRFESPKGLKCASIASKI